MEYWKEIRKHVGAMPIIMNGAAGAIVENNKILFVKHKQKQLWQIPGGLQELGESFGETIVREIKEELNVDVEVDKLLSIFSSSKWNIVYPNGVEIQQVTAFFLMKGKVNESNIRIQEDELDGYAFFDMDNIPDDTFECCKRKAEILRNWNGIVCME